MKSVLKLCLLIALLSCTVGSVYAVELDDVYRQLGNYRTVASEGVRLYYPEAAEEAIPRILAGLIRVRERMISIFPAQKNFEATVILNDHDDQISSSAENEFDWISLGMFEEIGVLSTRAYSLEKRFAMRLANIMLLRTLATADNSWRRKLAILAVPQWFLDGLALKYAFPLDSIHFSRLLDMARHDRLYSLDQLATILSQPTLIREEMRFQAHSMFEYWDRTYKKDAALQLMQSVFRKPAPFVQLFRSHYGVSLNEAFKSYRDYVCEKCNEFKQKADAQTFSIEDRDIGGHFFRSLRYLGPEEKIWVSSRRYSTESYDLFYQKSGRKPEILLKNVHPLLLVDEHSREIFIGKYSVNNQRQRRLGLWAVSPDGKSRCLVDESGSFKPLGRKFGRIFYTSIKSGITRVMSVDPEFKGSQQVEFTFPSSIKPLDLALSKNCRDLYYAFETDDFKKRLAVISIKNDDDEKRPRELFASAGDIRAIRCEGEKLWFAAEKDFFTTQLYSLDPVSGRIEKKTQLPGGVWDYCLNADTIEIVTLDRGEFWKTSMPATAENSEVLMAETPVDIEVARLKPVKSSKYRSEYHSSYWKPLLSEDEEGMVFGVYSYRTDRLGRSHIVVAPTYGLESRNWGYLGSYMQRFGLFKVTASIVDQVREKSYLANDYFERSRAKIVDITYPLNLSTTLAVGMDLTDRKIAEIPQNGLPVPTVGRDHSFYGTIRHLAVRTEPYWKVFPRKGRRAEASYKRGNEVLGGEMNYDSMSLRWEEYLPLKSDWVLTARTWLAEDDKENNIRRPDDLSLGGMDYMRAFDGAFKSGDSLRTLSLHLGRPIDFKIPRFLSWAYNEFMVAEVFWEMGDVKTQGNFAWQFDRGLEIRSQILLFRRLPMIIRMGIAKQHGFDKTNTYFTVDVSDLSEVFQ
jgi:hypothetical protein